jgi:hypothetical protein
VPVKVELAVSTVYATRASSCICNLCMKTYGRLLRTWMNELAGSVGFLVVLFCMHFFNVSN